MKKAFIIFSLLFVIVSCTKETTSPISNPEEEYYSIKLNAGGEIFSSDAPLTKAGASTDDLYGILVSTNPGEQGGVFAGGLFDSIDNVSLNLKKGVRYTIRCTLVKNGKNTVQYYQNGPSYLGYYEPFGRHENGSISDMTTEVKNYFGYQNGQPSYYYYNTYNHTLYGDVNFAWNVIASISPTKVLDRYFCEIADYVGTEGGTLTLDLKHTVLGIKYKITGLVDGTVALTIKRGEDTFVSESAISTNMESGGEVFECSDIYSAWQFPNTYKETATVSLVWTRAIGISQDLGSVDVDLLRNRMNVININLGAEDGDASLGINTEQAEMADESVLIEVE